jgi:hypothetical protein
MKRLFETNDVLNQVLEETLVHIGEKKAQATGSRGQLVHKSAILAPFVIELPMGRSASVALLLCFTAFLSPHGERLKETSPRFVCSVSRRLRL